jgi:hypothetical protein
LHGNSSISRVAAQAERLKKYLERNKVAANVQVVSAGNNQIALVVDVKDPSLRLVTRRLNSPHRVFVSSEKPFLLLAELNNRLASLKAEGRPAREEWHDGYKYYSDEPVNQMIGEIQTFVPSMRGQLLEVADSEPDPARRLDAIELLGWCSETEDTALNLLPALDDADGRVRAECARYLYARLASLPDHFPFDGLLQGLARMLDRPSHQDRSNSLYCLLKLCQLKEDVLPMAKSLCQRRVTELSQESILPSIKDKAQTLAVIFAKTLAPPGSSATEKKNEDSGI